MNGICTICDNVINKDESHIYFHNLSFHTICITIILNLGRNKNLPLEITWRLIPQLNEFFITLSKIGTYKQPSNYINQNKCSKCGRFPWKLCFKCRAKVCQDCWNPFCTPKIDHKFMCYICNNTTKNIFKCLVCRKNVCIKHRLSGCSRISICADCPIKIYCNKPDKCHYYDHFKCKSCDHLGNTNDMFCVDGQYTHVHCGSPKLKKIISLC